jgi:hypothetical protein
VKCIVNRGIDEMQYRRNLWKKRSRKIRVHVVADVKAARANGKRSYGLSECSSVIKQCGSARTGCRGEESRRS